MSSSFLKEGKRMQRYKLVIQYDGTPYVGFQVQENGNSIQAELNKALKKMTKGQYIPVSGSGRTDSGVHANAQVVHIDYPKTIEAASLVRAMNSLLPTSIRIVSAEAVSEDFHARYSVTGKRYIYKVTTAAIQSPFLRQYELHHPFKTDVERINKAFEAVIGEHDFTSFCSTKSDKDSKVRVVTKAEVKRNGDELIFTFEGKGFLYNMVRILVGTALQIGDGLREVEEMKQILEAMDRNAAGPTAPAHGLYLDEVFYKNFN